ncbi:hypothetical protein D8674_028824 [Pyrus ussuriensis x Pyrus communis]|uniref:MULE transposase domain-containing protein n=1 Tax=Pyrus ussuriensis x Pyrus communis TaxID=2448454 RepID=A0A5N5I0E3_9ROSA|nr:hypothetical protein D8674_028824 [Pyrus ussuriensis x Pyrus communis]
MWDLWELAEYLGYNKETIKFFYMKKMKGWIPITCDADYFQCAKFVTKGSIVVIYLTDKSQKLQNIEIQALLQNAITEINVEDVILIEGSHVAQEVGYVDLEGEYVADDECDEEDDREEYVVNGGALVDAELEVDDVVGEAEEPNEDFRDSDYNCARMVRLQKNDTVRVKMVCDGESEEGPCPWKLYASRVKRGPPFRIKTFIEGHTYGREEKAKIATSSWLAERFDEELRRILTCSKFHGNGSIEEQYGKLWEYCLEVKVENPGSTVLVKTKLRGDDPVFERMYICCDACRKGFKEGCKTMVGFDGCRIKGNHPGQLLSAIGIDANNEVFPVAFDKQKGLGLAIDNLMPDAQHRHCIRHLHSNFKSDGHNSLALKQGLGAAARATTIPTWQAEMDEILVLSESAYDRLGLRESSVKKGGHVAQTTRTTNEGGSQHQSMMHPRGSEEVLQGQSVITGEPIRFKSAAKRARTWRP